MFGAYLRGAFAVALSLISTEGSTHTVPPKVGPPPAMTVSVMAREVAITFNAAVLPNSATIEIARSSGTSIPLGPPAVDPRNDKRLLVPLKRPLSPGWYKMKWSAAVADSQPMEGNYTFTVRP